MYYKPVRVGNFWSRNYIEYDSNGDRNKILSIEEYPNKITPYLKHIINDYKKSSTCKIQLTITHIIAPVYQKSFGIDNIGAIYVFLVSHCYAWNKKTVNKQ